MSFADLIVFLLNILWLVGGVDLFFKKKHKLGNKEVKFLNYLFIYHQFLAIFYCVYVQKNGGDASSYWFVANRFALDASWISYFHTGTYFILFITYPLVKYLHVGFYMGGLLFGFVGYLSFIFLYVIIRKFVKRPIIIASIPVFPLLLFLPNMHFWTAGIGKDSLTTLVIILFFYYLLDIRHKIVQIIIVLAVSFYLRPHIAVFLSGSTFVAIIIDRKMKGYIKITLGSMIIAATYLLFDHILAFLKLEDVSVESITQFSATKAANLSKGAGSAVDMTNYPLPIKILTFLYRPLFFDISGILGIVASLENAAWLWLTIVMLRLKPFKAFMGAPLSIKSMVGFFVVSTVAFSLTLSNLGIMLRQKTPIMLCLYIFILWCVVFDKQIKLKKIALRRKKVVAAEPALNK